MSADNCKVSCQSHLHKPAQPCSLADGGHLDPRQRTPLTSPGSSNFTTGGECWLGAIVSGGIASSSQESPALLRGFVSTCEARSTTGGNIACECSCACLPSAKAQPVADCDCVTLSILLI